MAFVVSYEGRNYLGMTTGPSFMRATETQVDGNGNLPAQVVVDEDIFFEQWCLEDLDLNDQGDQLIQQLRTMIQLYDADKLNPDPQCKFQLGRSEYSIVSRIC